MTPSNPDSEFDLAATAVRTFLLYSLAEFQTGTAKTIKVTKQGAAFSISDDGRGHPLDKTLEGTSYLRFIYTHFDYPFEAGQAAPVQLQGLGMSLVNAMCSELTLTVRKERETLTVSFRDGQVHETHRTPVVPQDTGITVQARLRPGLPFDNAGDQRLAAWLRGIVQVHPTLRLHFNGRELQAGDDGDAPSLGRGQARHLALDPVSPRTLGAK